MPLIPRRCVSARRRGRVTSTRRCGSFICAYTSFFIEKVAGKLGKKPLHLLSISVYLLCGYCSWWCEFNLVY